MMSLPDIVNTEVPPLSWADNNLTTEQYEECGAEVCKPNPADIPTGKMLSYNMILGYCKLNFLFRGGGIKRCRNYV